MVNGLGFGSTGIRSGSFGWFRVDSGAKPRLKRELTFKTVYQTEERIYKTQSHYQFPFVRCAANYCRPLF